MVIIMTRQDFVNCQFVMVKDKMKKKKKKKKKKYKIKKIVPVW